MDTTFALRDLLTPTVALLAAGGTIMGVFLNLKANRRLQAKRQAFDAYERYLEHCLASPKLASGDVEFPKSVNGVWSDEFFKYQWVVARFLTSAEQIYEASFDTDWEGTQDEGGWYDAIFGDAEWHAKYFSSVYFGPQEFKMCSSEIRKIILEVVTPEARTTLQGGMHS